jgi:hypothetical protein
LRIVILLALTQEGSEARNRSAASLAGFRTILARTKECCGRSGQLSRPAQNCTQVQVLFAARRAKLSVAKESPGSPGGNWTLFENLGSENGLSGGSVGLQSLCDNLRMFARVVTSARKGETGGSVGLQALDKPPQ